jgi:hypothetical protein
MSPRDPAAVMRRAFDVWRGADCGDGRHPALQIIETSTEQTANLVQFAAVPAPERGTTLRFHAGALSRGDMVLYPSADPRRLAAIAVHEAGHFLGLVHSDDRAAIMSEAIERGVGLHADLVPDDVAAICAAYPPAAGDKPVAARAAATIAIAIIVGLAWRRRRRAPTTLAVH